MDEVAPEMLALARRACDLCGVTKYSDFRIHGEQIALAAIKETTERIERLLDKCSEPCPQCHEALRNLEHLK